MKLQKNKKTLLQRLNLLFYIIILSCAGMIFIAQVNPFLENVNKLIEGHIYVLVSKWDIPLFLCFPGFLAIIVGLILRLIDLDTERRMDVCTKIIIVFGLLFVITRIPYGFVTSYYLTSKGYSACWGLSSPSLMSPTVWVRDPGYCVNSASAVKSEILAWMDTLPDGGKNISPEDVNAKAEALHLLHEQQKREKYPDLYD